MRSAFLALVLAAGVHSLPELFISKRDVHGHASNVARGLLKRDDGTVTTNVFDIASFSSGGAYYANLTVGTPPQNQVVILDTGSSDLYFDASTADTCHTTGNTSCRGGTFDSDNSSTYKQLAPSPAFNTSFGDGSSAFGPYASDVVAIGDVVISGVQFGVADTVDSTTGYSLGLMGIGYSYNEAVGQDEDYYPNMPEVLASAGIIASRLYSIYLNDVGDVSGSILFGGIDTSKYTGDLVTLNLLPQYFASDTEPTITGVVTQFVTTVTGLSANIDGQQTTLISDGVDGIDAYSDSKTLPVLLDTGSAAWSVPDSTYYAIVKLFPFLDEYGSCACSHQNDDSTLTLEFGGAVSIDVPAREFIVPLYDPSTNEPVPYEATGDEDTCVFMISKGTPTGEGFLTLGDAILRSMYVVFDLDNGQVSIAQANVNSTSSPSIVTVGAGASGVASAISQSYSPATADQTWTIAPTAEGTVLLSASTAATTLGEATGTAAEPADAVATGGSIPYGPGTPNTDGSAASSGAASAIGMPAMDWSPVWSMTVMVFMGALGMAIML